MHSYECHKEESNPIHEFDVAATQIEQWVIWATRSNELYTVIPYNGEGSSYSQKTSDGKWVTP